MKMSKEEFVRCIAVIHRTYELMCDTEAQCGSEFQIRGKNLFEELGWICSDMGNMLAELTGDERGMVSSWLWEMDFGKHCEEPFTFISAEALYDCIEQEVSKTCRCT